MTATARRRRSRSKPNPLRALDRATAAADAGDASLVHLLRRSAGEIADAYDFGRFTMVRCRGYPNATRLLITADAGGSNGYRSRMFQAELAALAASIGLIITVCHMPPGTSKWNKLGWPGPVTLVA